MATQPTRTETLKEIEQNFGQVPEWFRQLPESALPSMWTMMRDFDLAETVIPSKYKHLISIAVAGATRCRYCALFHTEVARLHGATDAEVAEASAVGAVTMAASTFINAQQIDYDAFRRETLEIVAFVKKQSAKKAPATARPVQAHA